MRVRLKNAVSNVIVRWALFSTGHAPRPLPRVCVGGGEEGDGEGQEASA